jgi:endonuclease-3
MTQSVASKSKSDPRAIGRILKEVYPDATCELNFKTPLELLIATILAAQCTDARVNEVTKTLFTKYRSANDFAKADPEQMEEDIRSTGFFRQKAKSILGCCREIVDRYGGKVPADMDALTRLPGVGRKTANVVLGTAMGIACGVVVDTHVKRLSMRMGLSSQTDPEKIERDLMEAIPKKDWIAFGHQMTLHGRRVCAARKPQCDTCPLERVCPKIGVA